MTYKKKKIGFSSSNDIEAENFEQCIVCDKDTGGALFCCLEHSEEYNNNPAKYKKKLKKPIEVIEVVNPVTNDDNDDPESTIFGGHTIEWFGRQDQRHIQQIPASGRALILKEREVYVLGATTIFHICPISIPQLTSIQDRIDEEEKKDIAVFQPFVPAP